MNFEITITTLGTLMDDTNHTSQVGTQLYMSPEQVFVCLKISVYLSCNKQYWGDEIVDSVCWAVCKRSWSLIVITWFDWSDLVITHWFSNYVIRVGLPAGTLNLTRLFVVQLSVKWIKVWDWSGTLALLWNRRQRKRNLVNFAFGCPFFFHVCNDSLTIAIIIVLFWNSLSQQSFFLSWQCTFTSSPLTFGSVWKFPKKTF